MLDKDAIVTLDWAAQSWVVLSMSPHSKGEVAIFGAVRGRRSMAASSGSPVTRSATRVSILQSI
jgi:hypothetical protein